MQRTLHSGNVRWLQWWARDQIAQLSKYYSVALQATAGIKTYMLELTCLIRFARTTLFNVIVTSEFGVRFELRASEGARCRFPNISSVLVGFVRDAATLSKWNREPHYTQPGDTAGSHPSNANSKPSSSDKTKKRRQQQQNPTKTHCRV